MLANNRGIFHRRNHSGRDLQRRIGKRYVHILRGQVSILFEGK
jgi:hypothetical protein